MEQTFRIEAASWRDLNELRQLEKACFQKDAWPIWELFAVLVFPQGVRLKAVTAGGEVAGFISGDIRRWAGVGWITSLGVLPAFQRQGIGAALLANCEEKISMDRIRLCVRRTNQAAISLYVRAGYMQKEVWPHYYADNEDAFLMEKQRRK